MLKSDLYMITKRQFLVCVLPAAVDDSHVEDYRLSIYESTNLINRDSYIDSDSQGEYTS